jgi:hypothetical protein
MRYKYAAALVAVVATTLSLAAFAEKQALGGKVYLLKSGGKTIAELRVRASADVAIESANSSGHSEYNASTGAMVARGGAILKLTAGTNSISVRAEEIESVPDSK